MQCAISGEVPEEPVASKKSGIIFEKRLILKHLEADGRCPVTDEELAIDDLVEVKVTRPGRPRTAAMSSVPGVMAMLQTEWDELMLETHDLKEQLSAARQELSQALYQHDASCRVIARLVRERDDARSQLAEQRDSAADIVAAAGMPGTTAESFTPVEPAAVDMFADEILVRMKAKFDELSKPRRKRVMPADVAKKEVVSGYSVSVEEAALAGKGGVTCLAVHPLQRNMLLAGGANNTCVVVNAATRETVGVCEGHTMRVLSVAFHPTELVGLSGSEDSTCRVWRQQGDAFGQVAAFALHKAAVTSVSMHPLGDYFASGSLDGAWAMYDIPAERCIKMLPRAVDGGGLASIAFHPDGLILCTGAQRSGVVSLWDLRQKGQRAATLPMHQGAVTALAFSENGYLLATGGDDGDAALLDLRKAAEAGRFTVGSPVSAAAFDPSGSYLAAVGTSNVRVFGGSIKSHELICDLPPAAHAMTGLAWGPSARWLATADAGGKLRVFGEAPWEA